MSWKKGPMPSGTWGWGGVVPVGLKAQGFFFADFKGNSVVAIGAGTDGNSDRALSQDEVSFYNNSLELPPNPNATRLG